jgi:hypothetical protein
VDEAVDVRGADLCADPVAGHAGERGLPFPCGVASGEGYAPIA